MYLEISPRQSGKTTRMLNDISLLSRSHYTRHILPIVFVINLRVAKELHRILRDRYRYDRDIIFVTPKTFEKTLKTVKGDHKFYFDEFDFLNLPITSIDDEKLLESYFCTTPRFIRDMDDVKATDFLMRLLKLNKYKYTFNNIIGGATHGIKPGFKANELFGTFIK